MDDYTASIPYPTCQNLTFTPGPDGVLNITKSFTVASTLPSPVYPPLCRCMAHTLTCVANPASNISANYLAMLRTCGQNGTFCQSIISDGETGFYPTYRFCNTTE